MYSNIEQKGKHRVFSPVVLFHDHEWRRHDSNEIIHAHVSPKDGDYYEPHKQRVQEMLNSNGQFWLNVIQSTREIEAEEERLRAMDRIYTVHEPVHQSPMTSPVLHHPAYVQQAAIGPAHEPSADVTIKPVKRRRGNLPKHVTALLKTWLYNHKKHPYPTEEEKHALAKETKLTLNQISNWFINARRRVLPPLLDGEYGNNSQNELDIYPYEASDNSEDSTSDNGVPRNNVRRASKTGGSRTQKGGVKKPYTRRRKSSL